MLGHSSLLGESVWTEIATELDAKGYRAAPTGAADVVIAFRVSAVWQTKRVNAGDPDADYYVDQKIIEEIVEIDVVDPKRGVVCGTDLGRRRSQPRASWRMARCRKSRKSWRVSPLTTRRRTREIRTQSDRCDGLTAHTAARRAFPSSALRRAASPVVVGNWIAAEIAGWTRAFSGVCRSPRLGYRARKLSGGSDSIRAPRRAAVGRPWPRAS